MWKKQSVQEIVEHQAHRLGMRISRVCAWKTSALAFDGSGGVTRDQKNHSLAIFQNGKQYNCDLSASYNIGARYFIRELLKPVPETERSALEAKVPAVQRRTSCVYADLLKAQGGNDREAERSSVNTGSPAGGYHFCGKDFRKESELRRSADRRRTRSGCLKQPAAKAVSGSP